MADVSLATGISVRDLWESIGLEELRLMENAIERERAASSLATGMAVGKWLIDVFSGNKGASVSRNIDRVLRKSSRKGLSRILR